MTLTAALFEPHVGADVTVHLDDGTPFVLTLTRVSPESPMPPQDQGDASPRPRAFTMTLQGPHSPVIRALTYLVTFPEAEPVHLFLSPHYQDEAKTLYTIVIT